MPSVPPDPWQFANRGPGAKACSVCGTEIPEPRSRFESTCEAPSCRVSARLVEGRPKVLREMQAHAERRASERAALLERLREAADAMRRRSSCEPGATELPAFSLGVVPSNGLPLSELPVERGERFMAHLAQILDAAMRKGAPEPMPALPWSAPVFGPDPTPPLPALLQRQACTLCRGLCCRGGNEHAYQDHESVHQYLAANPEQTRDEVLARYRAHLPRSSFEGACVFQAEFGCALPREMRSVTCNRHLCNDLRRLSMTMTREGTDAAFVGAVEDRQILRMALLSSRPADGPGSAPADAAPAG